MMLLVALLAAAPPPAPQSADRPLAALAMTPPRASVPHQARPTREQVLAAVRTEWPKYDTRHTGKLGPLEFSTWVMRANGLAVAPAGARKAAGVKPVTAMNAASRAFGVADANHDGGVTPDEMAAFLMR